MRLDLLQESDLPVEFGRYRLVRVLGEGGMARVFEAELGGAEGFRKAVALKVVRGTETRKDPALRRALVREARLGGLLRHPGIVETYDFGDHEGQVFIAMELVRGAGLDDLLREPGQLPAAVVVDIALQVAEALDYAHTATDQGQPLQLVHRDLKPSNILVGHDGIVKVADFGIAKAATIAGDTRTGETKGTPLYMSPEQLEGAVLDGRSDLFAFGAMLWEMALGERLQRAESLPALVLATLRVDERLDEPGALMPLEQVVPGLGAVVAGCLRRKKEERYADAAAVVRDLRVIQARLPAADLRGWLRASPSFQSAPPSVEGALLDTVDTPPPPEAVPTRPQNLAAAAPPTRAQPAPRTSPLLLALAFLVVALIALVLGLLWRGASVEVTPVPADASKPGLRVEVAPVPPPTEPVATPEEVAAAPSPEPIRAPTAPRTPPPEPTGLTINRGAPAAGARPDPTPQAPPQAPGARPDPTPQASGARPDPTPQAPPPIRFTFADYEQIKSKRSRIRVRFDARTDCPYCTLTLRTRDARGDEQRAAMVKEDGTWSGTVEYPSSSAPHIKWWITARDPDGNTASYGTERKPEDAVVR